MPCNYQNPDGGLCNRSNVAGELVCIFHLWSESRTSSSADVGLRETFRQALQQLIDEKNGQWRGFAFPVPFSLSAKTIDFELDARNAHFGIIQLENVEFLQPVLFSNTVFMESFTARETTFAQEANFDYARFGGILELQRARFLKRTSFHRTEFEKPVLCRAYFAEYASFAEASFGSRVHFAGWRNVNVALGGVVALATAGAIGTSGAPTPTGLRRLLATMCAISRNIVVIAERAWRTARARFIGLSTRMREKLSAVRHRYARTSKNTDVFSVFGGEVEFTDVDFATPTLVSFSEVDLSRTYLRGTNLRGTRFLTVNWWQPKLRRNGLYDDLFIAKTSDGPFRWRYLPVLEETYRNVRLALEENKNYVAAADFYFGEMEAHRARLGFWQGNLFSVPAWYCTLTKYGTSVVRGLFVLGCLLVLHVLATSAVQGLGVETVAARLPEFLLRAVRIATLQQDDVMGIKSVLSQRWIDTAFRIFAAIQIALLIFAFRTRIKRH